LTAFAFEPVTAKLAVAFGNSISAWSLEEVTFKSDRGLQNQSPATSRQRTCRGQRIMCPLTAAARSGAFVCANNEQPSVTPAINAETIGCMRVPFVARLPARDPAIKLPAASGHRNAGQRCSRPAASRPVASRRRLPATSGLCNRQKSKNAGEAF
jgi:hypothetical protein